MINNDDISDRMIHGAENRLGKAKSDRLRGKGGAEPKGGENASAKLREGHSGLSDDQGKRSFDEKEEKQ